MKNSKYKYILSLLLLWCSIVSAESLFSRLAEKYEYTPKQLGACIVDLNRDSLLYGFNMDSLFLTASVAKLATGAMAAEAWGIQSTFENQIRYRGNFDRDSGIITGDVIFFSPADPGFTAERIWQLVQQLRMQGVVHIRGNLLLDDHFLQMQSHVPCFTDTISSYAYDAPAGALSANFNAVEIRVVPSDQVSKPPKVFVFPKIDGLYLSNNAISVQTGLQPRPRLLVYTAPEPHSTRVHVGGTIEVSGSSQVFYRKLWHTTPHFGGALAAQIAEGGILLDGNVMAVQQKVPQDSLSLLFSFDSQPLWHHIQSLFKYSNNVVAEMLFARLSATDSVAGTWGKSAEYAEQWWKNHQLADSVVQKNGSGMGSCCQMSPRHIVRLLRWVYHNKQIYPDYLAALSVAGKDGTLKDRFDGSPLAGIVRAKTGTLMSLGVSALAGYVLGAETTYGFCILMNAETISQMSHWSAQRYILENVFSKVTLAAN